MVLAGREGLTGSKKNPHPHIVSGVKGQRKISLTNAKEILRPRANENFSPENRTENLWAGSCIGAEEGRGERVWGEETWFGLVWRAAGLWPCHCVAFGPKAWGARMIPVHAMFRL